MKRQLLLPILMFCCSCAYAQKRYDVCYSYGPNLFGFTLADKKETRLSVIGADPALSLDGTRLAFTKYVVGDGKKIFFDMEVDDNAAEDGPPSAIFVYERQVKKTGACWALYIFSLKDFPNLEKAFKIDANLHIDELERNPKLANPWLSDNCDLNFRIDLKNIGYKDLFIDSVNTAVWLIPIESVSLDSSYLYFETLLRNDKVYLTEKEYAQILRLVRYLLSPKYDT